MGNIVTPLLHQPTRTGASKCGTARLHVRDAQPVTMILSTSHSGELAIDVEDYACSLDDCETVADALRKLRDTCTLAMLAAVDSRTAAPAVLGFLRNAFNAAKLLRTMLTQQGDSLLNSHNPSLADVTRILEEEVEALQDASRSLHHHHGLAYMVGIVDRGDADQATQEIFASLRKLDRLIVRDEATAAGVQAIKEIVGPINEMHSAIDVVRRIVTGRNIDDVPF